MRKQPSLKTIAEKTGFAITTISKALNDAPNISAKTKQNIRQVADELGYRPDRAGVALRTGQTHKIVLLLQLADEISDFTRQLTVGLCSVLRKTPYELVFHPVLPDQSELDELKVIIRNRAADGVVLAGTEPHDERVQYAIAEDFPVVTHGRTSLPYAHAFYDFDNEEFGYLATTRLAELGCENVKSFILSPNLTYCLHMQAGIARAQSETGLEVEQMQLGLGSNITYVRQIAHDMCCANTLPDGIICASEVVAMAIIDGVNSAGGCVKDHVKIITRKTSNLTDYIWPRVDYVSEDLIHAGEELANLLLKRIAGTAAGDLQIIGNPVVSWEH